MISRRSRLEKRNPMKLVLCTLVLLALPIGPSAEPALAQSDTPTVAAAANSSDAASPEEARRLRFLFWAYTVIWILLAGYLVSISLRLRTVRQELLRTRRRIEGSGHRET